jgi:hypothetical protein
MRNMPIDLAIVPGTSVTITIPKQDFHNGKVIHIGFELTSALIEVFRTAEGTETVSIQNGVGGTIYPLITKLGNIFYADRLKLGYVYALAFGNNGMPAAIPHFLNLNTPKKAWPINPANATPGPDPDQS